MLSTSYCDDASGYYSVCKVTFRDLEKGFWNPMDVDILLDPQKVITASIPGFKESLILSSVWKQNGFYLPCPLHHIQCCSLVHHFKKPSKSHTHTNGLKNPMAKTGKNKTKNGTTMICSIPYFHLNFQSPGTVKCSCCQFFFWRLTSVIFKTTSIMWNDFGDIEWKCLKMSKLPI